MQYVAPALSFLATRQRTRAEVDQMRLKQREAKVQASAKALQYQQKANEILRERTRMNSMLRAKAYAGRGGESGSINTLMALNNTNFGRDYLRAVQGAESSLKTGMIQSDIYRDSASQIKRAGRFDAYAKLTSTIETKKSTNNAPIVDRQLADK